MLLYLAWRYLLYFGRETPRKVTLMFIETALASGFLMWGVVLPAHVLWELQVASTASFLLLLLGVAAVLYLPIATHFRLFSCPFLFALFLCLAPYLYPSSLPSYVYGRNRDELCVWQELLAMPKDVMTLPCYII